LPFAFNLTLDPETSLKIERVYADLATLKIPDQDLITQYGPCVTILVVADRVHSDDIAQVLERQLPSKTSLSVAFTEPCIILGTPPALSLRVSPTSKLLALHNAIYTEMPEQEVHLHYRPAYWQPHLKLSNVHGGRAAAGGLVAAIAAGWRTQSGVLDRLEVIQYPPVQAIWQAPLKRASASRPGSL
jgi:hypothetical protein